MEQTALPPYDVSQIQMELAQVLALEIDNPYPPLQLEGTTFKFYRKLQLIHTDDPQRLGVIANFDIELLNNEENTEPIANFSAEMIFGYLVPNLAAYIELAPPNNYIDNNLHLSLLTLSYSTARGILSEKSKSTLFEDAFLPIVPPIALVNHSPEESMQEE